MRLVATLLAAAPLLSTATRANACPETVANQVTTDEGPTTASPCMRDVDFTAVRRVFQISYAVGAGGTTQSGVGHAASAFAGLELAYGAAFGGNEEQASYELEMTAGATGQQIGGDVEATGLVTKAGARIGPARMNASTLDEGKANFAFFPLTLEVAHTGELAARPRLAARPELARKLYGRERVELATRLVRVEGAGEKASTAAPGMTEPKKPTAWALDVIPLHGGLDVAMQDGTRFETTIGGAMLGVREHTTNIEAEIFGIEHRRIDLPMTGATDLDTVWMLRVDGVDPYTGAQYYVGWGEVIAMPDRDELAQRLDPEGKSITIGGVGWYSQRSWGGFGAQYKREPFVTMAGAVVLEDRVSGEVYVPRTIGIVARVFGARTTRLVDTDLVHDTTAGVSLDATYVRGGFSSKLGLEVGRTFYTALDGVMPETTGFAANLGLTIQAAGGHSWER